MPGTAPPRTYASSARRFPSPFAALKAERGIRHHMHQQPPHAPRGLKSASRSAQRSGVSG